MRATSCFETTENEAREWRIPGTALIVDPDLILLEAGRILLASLCRSVRIACTRIEVSRLSEDIDLGIAVLSDRMGAIQLISVAEYIRHRWPHARILIVGQAESLLEDHHYDEALAAGPSNLAFLSAIEECMRQLIAGRGFPR